jgi:hypothetical protein
MCHLEKGDLNYLDMIISDIGIFENSIYSVAPYSGQTWKSYVGKCIYAQLPKIVRYELFFS